MKATQIIIPYYAAEAQSDELLYAIDGWFRFACFPIEITFVGDWHPGLSNRNVRFYHLDRVKAEDFPGEYLPHIDISRKINHGLSKLSSIDKFPDDGFIVSPDDVFALRKFDLLDVMTTKANIGSYDIASEDSPDPWNRDLYKTRQALKGVGYEPFFQFTTHTPRWYNTRRYLEIQQRFNCRNHSYVLEDLYFTGLVDKPSVVLQNEDAGPWRLRIAPQPYRTSRDIRRLISWHEPKWACTTSDGWCQELEDVLDWLYYCKNI